MVITEDEVEAIENWRFDNRVGSKSDAVRRLVQMGLIAGEASKELTASALGGAVSDQILIEQIQSFELYVTERCPDGEVAESLANFRIFIEGYTGERLAHFMQTMSFLRKLSTAGNVEFDIEDLLASTERHDEIRERISDAPHYAADRPADQQGEKVVRSTDTLGGERYGNSHDADRVSSKAPPRSKGVRSAHSLSQKRHRNSDNGEGGK